MKRISTLVIATVGGAVLMLPGTASAGVVQVPQNVLESGYATGIVPVHARRHAPHSNGYGYNNGAAIAGAILGGLAYGYGRRSYRPHSYGYGGYGYRRSYSYGYPRSYGYSYGGYGGYGMYGGYR